LKSDFYGLTEVSALVLDLENYNVGRRLFVLNQACSGAFTSWSKGSFKTEVSVFIKLLEHEGDLSLNLFNNRGSGVNVNKGHLG